MVGYDKHIKSAIKGVWEPRATRPQVPFQGPPRGLVFSPDNGVNGTTIPQTLQTQHAHIMRVHLAGCCKGQAQQYETMQCETMQCEQQSAVTTIFENTHVYGTIF